jgi:hypothetical protein
VVEVLDVEVGVVTAEVVGEVEAGGMLVGEVEVGGTAVVGTLLVEELADPPESSPQPCAASRSPITATERINARMLVSSPRGLVVIVPPGHHAERVSGH